MVRRWLGPSLAALILFLQVASSLNAQSSPIDSVQALLDADLTDEALAYSRSAVEARPEDAASHCALAVAAIYGEEDFDLAMESAERCVELAPRVAEHQYVLGDACLSKLDAGGRGLSGLGLAKRGKAALEKALRLDPDHVPARMMYFQYHLEAPRIAGGSKKEARRQVEEISRRDPARGVWAQLRVLGDKAKDKDLEGVFESGLPLAGSDQDPKGYAMRAATSAANRIESDALREKLVGTLYTGRPDDPRARYTRARLWTLQGRNLEQAEDIFLEYVALSEYPPRSPSKAGAYWRLGLVYEKQDRVEDALQAYRKAVELLFQRAIEDVERLEKMR